MSVPEFAVFIPIIPMVAFGLILILGQLAGDSKWWRGPFKEGGSIAVISLAACLILTVIVGLDVTKNDHGGEPTHIIEWLRTDEMSQASDGTWSVHEAPAISFGIQLDHTSLMLLFVATFLCFLISWFSLGYMNSDSINEGRLHRFYAEFVLFASGMFGMVLADSFLWLFIFWEIMGLCSYLLIGFYFDRPSAAAAAKKAFLTTRVGDVFLLVGLLILYGIYGSLDFAVIFADPSLGGLIDVNLLRTAMILLFVGAVGKSAQFPLHVWLPDAMEGPTPVSALIHAATMVNAGLYLVARMYPFFDVAHGGVEGISDVGLIIAWIGAITAVMAALLAFVQMDLKRVLAYSTMSQLAYIFLGLGVSLWAINRGHEALAALAIGSALFHLFNHAMAKGMLFMASGSVIHEMHHAHHEIEHHSDGNGHFDAQSMENMGGLASRMPVTSLAMAIGSASIIGLPLIGGFWSKEGIIGSVWRAVIEDGGFALLVPAILAILTAAMTGFYMTRMWAMTFLGEPRTDVAKGVHEQTPWIRMPLVVLSIVSLLGIALFALGSEEWITHGLVSSHESGSHGGAGDRILHAFTGDGLYTAGVTWVTIILATFFGPIWALRIHGGALDSGQKASFPIRWLPGFSSGLPPYDPTHLATSSFADALRRRLYFDEVYDALIRKFVVGCAAICAIFDRRAVDGVVKQVESKSIAASHWIRKFTTGSARDYIAMASIGIISIFIIIGGST